METKITSGESSTPPLVVGGEVEKKTVTVEDEDKTKPKIFSFAVLEVFKKALAPLKGLLGGSTLDSLDDQGFLRNQSDAEKSKVSQKKQEIQKKFAEYQGSNPLGNLLLKAVSSEKSKNDSLEFLQKETDFPLLPLEEQQSFLQGPPLNLSSDEAKASPSLKWSKGQRLFQAATREAKDRWDKGDCKGAAELYGAAAKLDPSNTDVRMAAARNYKEAAEKTDDPAEKEKLYGLALGQLKEVALLDAKDTWSLEIAANILKAQKKPDQVKKIQGEIFDREVKGLDAEILEFNAYAQSKPKKAMNCITRIEKIEARIEKLGIQDPEKKLAYLSKLRGFYSKAVEYKKAQPLPEDQKDSIQAVALTETVALTGVSARITTLREEIRKAAQPAPGAKPNADQIAKAGLVVKIDRELGDYAAMTADLDTWNALVGQCPGETLDSGAKAGQYAEILKGWVEVRDRVKGKVPYAIDAQHPAISLKAEGVNAKMKSAGESLVAASASLETSQAKDSIATLVNSVVIEDDHGVLDFLAPGGPQKFAELKNQAQTNLEKANQITDPEKKRVAVVVAFGQFAALKDKAMTEKLAGQIETDLQGPNVTDELRLQVYTAMSASLRGSGLEQETKVKEKAGKLAQAQVEGRLEAYTSEGMKKKVGGLLLATAYYQSIGDPSSDKEIRKQLDIQKHLLVSFLREGDPVHQVKPPTDGLQRVELAGLAAQISAMNLLPNLNEASKGSPDGPPPPELPLKNALVTAKLWREEIEKAKDLPLEVKLQQLSKLSVTLVGYKPLTKGHDPIVSGSELYHETSAVRKILDPMVDDLFAPGPEATETQKKMNALVSADVKERVYTAFFDGDAKWFSGLSLAQLREVGETSQMGHALLMVAKESKDPEASKKYLQAAQVFAKAGLKDRVDESLAPVVEKAKSNPDAEQGGSMLLMAAQFYQSAGMTGKSDEVFDQIVALDKPGAPTALHELGVLAKASQLLNHGKIEKAKDLLLDLPENPMAKLLLQNIDVGEKQLRTSKTLTVVRVVMEGYIQGFVAKGKKDEAAKMGDQLEGGLKEIQRLMASGECATLDAAYSKVSHDPRFGVFYGAETVFQEKYPELSPEKILRVLSSPSLSDEAHAKRVAELVHSLTVAQHPAEAEMLCRSLFDDPYVGEEMRAYATDAGGFKGVAIANSALTAVTTLTPLGIYASSLNPNSKQFYEGLESAGITVASFGIARGAAVGAEALFLATDAAVILGKASPAALKLAGFGVKTGTEAAAFTVTNMFFQSAKTGTWSNWTAENFGKEFGSMLVTFVLLHGVGAGIQKVGQVAEKSSWLGMGAEEAAKLKASGQMALKPGAKLAFGIGSWGVRVSAFAGSEYVNEGLGLKPGEDVPFLVRFLGSAVTDAQMIVAGKLVDGISGSKISKLEMSSKTKYEVHELLPELKKMGFELDAKAVLSKGSGTQPNSPGEAVLQLLVMRKMQGLPVDGILESSKEMKDLVQAKFKLDPKSAAGQEMMANLLSYSVRAGGNKVLSGAELTSTVTGLMENSKRLLNSMGVKNGPDFELHQKTFVDFAIQQGKSPKDIEAFFKQASGMTKEIPSLVDAVLGGKASATPTGQKMTGKLLLLAFARFQTGEAGKVGEVDKAFAGVNPLPASTNILEGLKTLAGKENAESMAKALSVNVENLLGKGADKTPLGQELMAQLFLAELSGTEKASELPMRLFSLNNQLLKFSGLGSKGKDLAASLEITVDSVAGKNYSKTPEGRELMAQLLLAQLSTNVDAEGVEVSVKSQSYQAVAYGDRLKAIAEAGKIGPRDRFALFSSFLQSKMGPEQLDGLVKDVKDGKVEISVQDGKLKIEKLGELGDKDIVSEEGETGKPGTPTNPEVFLDFVLKQGKFLAPEGMDAAKRVAALREWTQKNPEVLSQCQKDMAAGTHVFAITFDGKARFVKSAELKQEIAATLKVATELGFDVKDKAFRESLVLAVLSSTVKASDAAVIYKALGPDFEAGSKSIKVELRQQALLKIFQGQVTAKNASDFGKQVLEGKSIPGEESTIDESPSGNLDKTQNDAPPEANYGPSEGDISGVSEAKGDKTAETPPPSVTEVKTGPFGSVTPLVASRLKSFVSKFRGDTEAWAKQDPADRESPKDFQAKQLAQAKKFWESLGRPEDTDLLKSLATLVVTEMKAAEKTYGSKTGEVAANDVPMDSAAFQKKAPLEKGDASLPPLTWKGKEDLPPWTGEKGPRKDSYDHAVEAWRDNVQAKDDGPSHVEHWGEMAELPAGGDVQAKEALRLLEEIHEDAETLRTMDAFEVNPEVTKALQAKLDGNLERLRFYQKNLQAGIDGEPVPAIKRSELVRSKNLSDWQTARNAVAELREKISQSPLLGTEGFSNVSKVIKDIAKKRASQQALSTEEQTLYADFTLYREKKSIVSAYTGEYSAASGFVKGYESAEAENGKTLDGSDEKAKLVFSSSSEPAEKAAAKEIRAAIRELKSMNEKIAVLEKEIPTLKAGEKQGAQNELEALQGEVPKLQGKVESWEKVQAEKYSEKKDWLKKYKVLSEAWTTMEFAHDPAAQAAATDVLEAIGQLDGLNVAIQGLEKKIPGLEGKEKAQAAKDLQQLQGMRARNLKLIATWDEVDEDYAGSVLAFSKITEPFEQDEVRINSRDRNIDFIRSDIAQKYKGDTKAYYRAFAERTGSKTDFFAKYGDNIAGFVEAEILPPRQSPVDFLSVESSPVAEYPLHYKADFMKGFYGSLDRLNLEMRIRVKPGDRAVMMDYLSKKYSDPASNAKLVERHEGFLVIETLQPKGLKMKVSVLEAEEKAESLEPPHPPQVGPESAPDSAPITVDKGAPIPPKPNNVSIAGEGFTVSFARSGQAEKVELNGAMLYFRSKKTKDGEKFEVAVFNDKTEVASGEGGEARKIPGSKVGQAMVWTPIHVGDRIGTDGLVFQGMVPVETSVKPGDAKLGAADFKTMPEVEAKADKIAKATPSPERIARYTEYLMKKGVPALEAEGQAILWAEQVILDARNNQVSQTHIYDTSLPAKPATAHLDKATIDHHGRFGNPKNATEQLLDRFEATLDTLRGDKKALDAAGKDKAAMQAAGGDPLVAAALRELNLKEVTTDNLADGGWCVWIAKNQAKVLKEPGLRKLISQATHFEDFTAFGTEYNSQDPGVRLQAALFQKYGEILKAHGVVGSDRMPPEKAKAMMEEALAVIDLMVSDPSAREAAAKEFFQKVDAGKDQAAAKALMGEPSVHEGKTNLSFFDLTKLGDFTVFQQWLALPRVEPSPGNPDSLQVSVVPMKPAAKADGTTVPKTLQIVAIPNGRELPSGKGLLSVLEKINAAEKAKAEKLGVEPNVWFGKDNVILPNPMKGGTVLTTEEVSAILTSPELGLFHPRPEPPKPELDSASLASPKAPFALPLDGSRRAEVAAAFIAAYENPKNPIHGDPEYQASYQAAKDYLAASKAGKPWPASATFLVDYQVLVKSEQTPGLVVFAEASTAPEKQWQVSSVDPKSGAMKLVQAKTGKELVVRAVIPGKNAFGVGDTVQFLPSVAGASDGEFRSIVPAPGQEEIVIGRDPTQAGYVVSDSAVSRRHCSLRYTDQGWYVADLKSLNGVYLNGKKVEGSAWVKSGDVLSIKDTNGQFHILGVFEEPAKPAPKIAVLPKAPLGDAKFSSSEALLYGDVALKNPPVYQLKADALGGSASGVTTQGEATGKANEDNVLILKGKEGTFLLDTDGMGGMGNGDSAALLTAEAFKTELKRSGDVGAAWQLANSAIRRFNGQMKLMKQMNQYADPELALEAGRALIADPIGNADGPMAMGAGAVSVAVQIHPPQSPGAPSRVEFSWAGDARAVMIERGPDGKWQWVYRTVDESAPGGKDEYGKDILTPGVDFEFGGKNRTLALAMHPNANMVSNSLGIVSEVTVKTTANGEFPDPSQAIGARPAGEVYKDGIAIKEGQMILAGSDGFWEQFGSTREVLDLIEYCKTAEQAREVLTHEAHERMKILGAARTWLDAHPGQNRCPFKHHGKTLFIDYQGGVYENGIGGKAVNHYKTDNFSLITYLHDPKPGAAIQPKPEAKVAVPLPKPLPAAAHGKAAPLEHWGKAGLETSDPKSATEIGPRFTDIIAGKAIPLKDLGDGTYEWSKEVRLQPTKDGTWEIVDGRDPVAVKKAAEAMAKNYAMLGHDNNPIYVNNKMVIPGEPFRLLPGDQISGGNRFVKFSISKPHAFDGELGNLPAMAKFALEARFMAADNFAELRQVVQGSGLPSASENIVALDSCLAGKASVDSLPEMLRKPVLRIMGDRLVELKGNIPKGYDPELSLLDYKGGLDPIEKRYHAAVAFLEFEGKLKAATSFEEVRDLLQGTPLESPEGISKQALIGALESFRSGKGGIQDIPKGLTFRQKIREIWEKKNIDLLNEEAVPSVKDPAAVKVSKDLDELGMQLYRQIRTFGKIKSGDIEYTPAQLTEIVYEVLERGKSLEKVTNQKGVRDLVLIYMRSAIERARALLGSDRVESEKNYFTGEKIEGSDVPAKYRFAMMLIHQKAGKSIYGEPSAREMEILQKFSSEKLGDKKAKSYPEFQAIVRDHLERLSPEIQKALSEADPETRALVMEAFFGGFRHRQMKSPTQATAIASFMGKIGFYRELGVTLDFSSGQTKANLTLGETAHVSAEDRGVYFLMHTHPTDVGSKGKVMGKNVTLNLGVGSMMDNDYDVLFSTTDLKLYLHTAKEVFSLNKYSEKDTSLFYDPARRVFKNWVQHRQGLSQAEVFLDESGKPKEIVVSYGLYPDSEGISNAYGFNYEMQARTLVRWGRDHGIKVKVQQVDPTLLESGMPK